MTIVLVHGLLGNPENCFFPWLRREIEARGDQVIAPAMPMPAIPQREAWVETLRGLSLNPEETILLGHSLGCAAIVHFLEAHEGPLFRGVVLVAGFGRPFMIPSGPFARRLGWFEHELDLKRVAVQSRFWTHIYSTNDLLVPHRESEWLASQVGGECVVEKMGHFRRREGAEKLPSALRALYPEG